MVGKNCLKMPGEEFASKREEKRIKQKAIILVLWVRHQKPIECNLIYIKLQGQSHRNVFQLLGRGCAKWPIRARELVFFF